MKVVHDWMQHREERQPVFEDHVKGGDGVYCNAFCSSTPWQCTRRKGHSGNHEALDSDEASCAEWGD